MARRLIKLYRGKACPIQRALPYERWPEYFDRCESSLQAHNRFAFKALCRPDSGAPYSMPLDAPEVIPDGSTIRTEDHFEDVVKFKARERVLPREGGWRE